MSALQLKSWGLLQWIFANPAGICGQVRRIVRLLGRLAPSPGNRPPLDEAKCRPASLEMSSAASNLSSIEQMVLSHVVVQKHERLFRNEKQSIRLKADVWRSSLPHDIVHRVQDFYQTQYEEGCCSKGRNKKLLSVGYKARG